MPLRKYLERLDRLHSLIRRKATGSPRELAERLDLSERQLYEYLQEMRDMGAPVRFCKHRKCYYYEKDVRLQLGFVEMSVEEAEMSTGGALLKSFGRLQSLIDSDRQHWVLWNGQKYA